MDLQFDVWVGPLWELLRRVDMRPAAEGRYERNAMSEKNSGPQEGIKGVVEDVKGKAKEAVGTVTGRDDLINEGKAQQDKAEAQRDVAKREAEADAARGAAAAAEKRQEAHQR